MSLKALKATPGDGGKARTYTFAQPITTTKREEEKEQEQPAETEEEEESSYYCSEDEEVESEINEGPISEAE